MLGFVKFANKAYPNAAASVEAAIGEVRKLKTGLPRNIQELTCRLPPDWRSCLDGLADQHLQMRQGRREPYIYAARDDIDRTSPPWLMYRTRYELRARTILCRLRSAGLTGALTWNGQAGDSALAARALAELKIPTLFAELSPFKGRFFLDHLGVNAASSLQHTDPHQLPAYEDEDLLFDNLRRSYLGRHSSVGKVSASANLPNSFVFAALQVPTDTQTLLHGEAIQSQTEFLALLADIALRLPHNIQLAVKPHPQSPYKPSHLHNAIGKNIFIASDVETRTLLERCEALITVNSTVGVDAFLFDKPVFAVGNAPWIKRPLALPVRTAGDIVELIAAPPAFDKALRKQFLAHWYHAFTWSADDEPRKVRAFIEQKLETSRQHRASSA